MSEHNTEGASQNLQPVVYPAPALGASTISVRADENGIYIDLLLRDPSASHTAHAQVGDSFMCGVANSVAATLKDVVPLQLQDFAGTVTQSMIDQGHYATKTAPGTFADAVVGYGINPLGEVYLVTMTHRKDSNYYFSAMQEVAIDMTRQ
jgi:hypothetical protein